MDAAVLQKINDLSADIGKAVKCDELTVALAGLLDNVIKADLLLVDIYIKHQDEIRIEPICADAGNMGHVLIKGTYFHEEGYLQFVDGADDDVEDDEENEEDEEEGCFVVGTYQNALPF